MPKTTTMHSLRDVLMTALAPIIWGSTYIVTTEFLPPDRPFTAALIRVLPAGLLLLLLTRRLLQVSEWGRLIILGMLNIGLFQGLLFVAAYRLPGGLAAVVGALQPLLIMILIWAVDKRAPAQITLWAAIAGVVGMAILLMSPHTVFDPIGILAALLSAVSMATGVWLTRSWHIHLPVFALTGWQLLIGGVILIPIAYWQDAPLPVLTLSQWIAYAYLCLAGALLAYAVWFRGVTILPMVAVVSLGLLSPITAVLLGWVFLSQAITGVSLIGLLIVLISIFIVQWSAARSK